MYNTRNGMTFVVDDDGSERLLANFCATISQEIHFIDGDNSETYVVLTGTQHDEDGNEITLPSIKLPADKFMQMGWPIANWGVRAVVQPGGGAKDALRTQIQLASKPLVSAIYTHTGWQKTGKRVMYLHARGAITSKGNDSTVAVQLPHELCNYDLSPPATPVSPKASILNSLDLHQIAPANVAWTLLAATIAPILGPCDFAIHVAGRTGTYKSEIASLFQSHYGERMDARHLPASWSSTPNALEAIAYRAKDTLLCVDDFIPTGTSWQQKSYQKTADQIIRGQGNQAGRARLTDISSLQQTMYPRGLILSTGEDIPEGHSVRARMMILELSPGDVKTDILTAFQRMRSTFPGTIAALTASIADDIVSVASRIKARSNEIRDTCLDVGHSRTPSMIGRLIASIEFFLAKALEMEAISQHVFDELKHKATLAIRQAGDSQEAYLMATDPCEMFVAAIRLLIDGKQAHVRSHTGGVPRNADLMGWTKSENGSDFATYATNGKQLGWVNTDANEFYLDQGLGFQLVTKQAGLTLTKQTMVKRLKDAGILARTDETRQRNTVRVVCDGHPRQVITIPLQLILQGDPE